LSEKEHFGTSKKSKLLPEARQQMEQLKILMLPENT